MKPGWTLGRAGPVQFGRDIAAGAAKTIGKLRHFKVRSGDVIAGESKILSDGGICQRQAGDESQGFEHGIPTLSWVNIDMGWRLITNGQAAGAWPGLAASFISASCGGSIGPATGLGA